MKRNHTIKTIITTFITLISISAFASAATKTLTSGSWTKKDKSISGKWEIVDHGAGAILKLRSFKTSNAPDLKIFFHKKSISAVNAKNATTGSKFLANLKSSKGYQEYKLPKGFKLSDYKSIIIHCEQFTKLWGGANL